ncbi:MAG: hypothetical protein Q8P22_10910 [Chloroflexota bacterium]|nr:hypothetical protein [Chloroflexota bacterium]
MAVDLDVIFLALLFLVWAVLGLIPWLVAAVIRRGRGALMTLPLAIVGGAGGGVLVPAAGARDEAGLFLSLSTALLGGLALSLLGPKMSRRSGPLPRPPE